MPHLPEDRLALVRKLYESSELTIAEIAILADVSESAIYQRARREQWPSTRRPGITPRKHKLRPPRPLTPALRALAGQTESGDPEAGQPEAGQPELAPSGDGEPPQAVDRAATAGRLWRAIDLHLQDLHDAAAPAGTIRAAQTLAALARTLQTLVDVERGLVQEQQDRAGARKRPEDMDALRNRIARRLEALLEEEED